jgi:DNA-binding beta-propeller fold protein YncE
MNYLNHFSRVLFVAVAGIGMLAFGSSAQTSPTAKPYSIVNLTQTMGTGGTDYVYADNDGRRLYVPRGGIILVYDLDTLKAVGTIAGSGGHGVAVDPQTHHGFSSSSPVTMFDTTTLQVIKKITVEGGPDGILFEPATEKVYVLSHRAPNVTVIDAKDGSIAGTIDLGGAPEQGASDGKGHVYIDVEDQDNVAVVDANTLKVTAHYPLQGKGGGPAGLGFDIKNHILFAMCHNPQTCVILNSDDGKILDTLPIAGGTDGGGFNPNTMEAFSSQGNGTLTVIKETSPTSFMVETNVPTKQGARTCTLDTKNDRIILITTERAPATNAAPAVAVSTPPQAAAGTPPANGADQPAGGRRGGRGGGGGPGMLDIIAVGR